MKNFWFISLCALFVIAFAVDWNIPIRIAVGANAILVLIDIVKRLRELKNGRKEKKN